MHSSDRQQKVRLEWDYLLVGARGGGPNAIHIWNWLAADHGWSPPCLQEKEGKRVRYIRIHQSEKDRGREGTATFSGLAILWLSIVVGKVTTQSS